MFGKFSLFSRSYRIITGAVPPQRCQTADPPSAERFRKQIIHAAVADCDV